MKNPEPELYKKEIILRVKTGMKQLRIKTEFRSERKKGGN